MQLFHNGSKHTSNTRNKERKKQQRKKDFTEHKHKSSTQLFPSGSKYTINACILSILDTGHLIKCKLTLATQSPEMFLPL